MPKMVPRNHGYALAHAVTGRYWMDLRKGDIHWTLSDTGWGKAAWGMLYGPWQMGATNILYDGGAFDADLHLKLVKRLGVTTFRRRPPFTGCSRNSTWPAMTWARSGTRMSAGEPLNPEVIKIWKEATGGLIYGRLRSRPKQSGRGGQLPVPGAGCLMGKPVPASRSTSSMMHAPVANDEIGQIAIRVTDPHPVGLFDGYWHDEAATAKSFHHGWYYTGDTATRDADGYFGSWGGRTTSSVRLATESRRSRSRARC
ncbi:MAG: AMP-binding protein [Burkholderiaceae bacterium]